MDTAFIDPTNAGTTNVKPAAVTYNVSDASGGSPASASAADDIETLVSIFSGDLDKAYLVMPPLLAAKLSSADRPNIGARGGERESGGD